MGPKTSTDPKSFQIPVQPNGENFGDNSYLTPNTDQMTVPLTDAFARLTGMIDPAEARKYAVSTADYYANNGKEAVNTPYVAQKFGEMIDPTWVEGQLPPEAAAYFNTQASKEPVNSYVQALAGDQQMHAEAYHMAVPTASYSERNATKERVPTPQEIARLSQAVVAWRQDALGNQDPRTISTLRTK